MPTIHIKELDPDIIPPITSRVYDPKYHGGSKLVVVGKPGCFARGTQVMTFTGRKVNVEDVVEGMQLMGDDSSPRNVLELCNNREMMYEIQPDNGISYTVNENHILSLKRFIEYREELIDITVKEYLKKSESFKSSCRWYRVPVELAAKQVCADPYALGYWLGDSFRDIESFQEKIIENSLNDIELEKGFFKNLANMGLLEKKLIPIQYKLNSKKIRKRVLAGIIDSCGTYSTLNQSITIHSNSKKLLYDIVDVAQTLGVFAEVKEYSCSLFGDLWTIESNLLKDFPECLNDYTNVKFTIIPKEEDEYFGFVLDGNHRFLGTDCSVLHNTGKSTLIKSLLYHKKHIFPVGLALSGSEDSNHAYSEFLPEAFVFEEYNEKKIEDFVNRQKLAAAHIPNPWCVLILDDCTDDVRIFNTPLMNAMYKKGRHWKMMYILSLQYAMDVKPVIRTNVDGIFILREPLLKNREGLYRNYASIVPDFNTFCALMDQLTDDYCAIYIHNATQTNNWEDCVFYWKAPQAPKDWKLGCPEYWEFSNSRLNKDYVRDYSKY